MADPLIFDGILAAIGRNSHAVRSDGVGSGFVPPRWNPDLADSGLKYLSTDLHGRG